MTSLKFEIPGNPIAKGRPRFYRRGRHIGTYTPQRTMIAEDSIRRIALLNKPRDIFTGPLHVCIDFWLPIPKNLQKKKPLPFEHTKKPDIDNLIKLILDGCNGIIWQDDKQICKLSVTKCYGMMPRTFVEVEQT